MKDLKSGISVTIIASNEEHNISKCLQSLNGIADEIILVHNDCIDRTVEVAKSFGARCFEEKWHGHRDQKIDDYVCANLSCSIHGEGMMRTFYGYSYH